MSGIDAVLEERGQKYGEFEDHATVSQSIKQAMQDSKNWNGLDYDMTECLEMVAHKIGRILNGDPYHIDSWTDICGYVRLVEKRLIEQKAEASETDEPCDNPGCPVHGEIGKAIQILRKAGLFGLS